MSSAQERDRAKIVLSVAQNPDYGPSGEPNEETDAANEGSSEEEEKRRRERKLIMEHVEFALDKEEDFMVIHGKRPRDATTIPRPLNVLILEPGNMIHHILAAQTETKDVI